MRLLILQLDLFPLPAQNQHMQDKHFGVLVFARVCGACIRTRASAGKYFRGISFRIFCQNLSGIHLRRIQEISRRIIYVLVSCQGVFGFP